LAYEIIYSRIYLLRKNIFGMDKSESQFQIQK